MINCSQLSKRIYESVRVNEKAWLYKYGCLRYRVRPQLSGYKSRFKFSPRINVYIVHSLAFVFKYVPIWHVYPDHCVWTNFQVKVIKRFNKILFDLMER